MSMDSSSTSTIKLNTYEARDSVLGLATLTIVARDGSGNWVRRIGRNIGRYGVEQTELWMIYDRLIMTWDAQWRDIFVETDYAFAFKEIIRELRKCVQRYLILRIRELISHNWNVAFKQIPREVNSVAHSLVGMMKEVSVGIQIFHSIPLWSIIL
ncbi:hypothetical protein PVK06_028855 [Gossypium arboreum]|uniref:RNase H type-1 domain-containing protein n=1 Tax=Gossypium arboreum TaxID=29729 RepID=A0ABR0P4Y5_GOSAR|nr:hypothetical protein PVK06_028855 [Gossypium arboreum]